MNTNQKKYLSAISTAPSICLIAIFLITIMVGKSQALPVDTSEMMATYGRGVHAYFSGQQSQAEQLFSQVIGAGSKDPRVYYFRAMVLLQQGRKHEAESDMRIGAAFEAENPGNRMAVSRSLQRVQGYHRKTLENYRRQARLERLQMIRMQSQDRYEQLQRRNDTVLHKDAPVQLESLADPKMQKAMPGKVNESPKPKAPQNDPPANSQDPDDIFGSSSSEDSGLFESDADPEFDQGDPFPSDETDVPANEEEQEGDDDFDIFGGNSQDSSDPSLEEPVIDSSQTQPATAMTVPSTPGEQVVSSTFFALGQWLSGRDLSSTTLPGATSSFEESEGVSQVGFDDFGEGSIEVSEVASDEVEDDNANELFDFE